MDQEKFEELLDDRMSSIENRLSKLEQGMRWVIIIICVGTAFLIDHFFGTYWTLLFSVCLGSVGLFLSYRSKQSGQSDEKDVPLDAGSILSEQRDPPKEE